VCVYGTLENCHTFRVRYGARGPELGADVRRCLVLYYYWTLAKILSEKA